MGPLTGNSGISLVFREMWDTTKPNDLPCRATQAVVGRKSVNGRCSTISTGLDIGEML
jgi:hypothetical protein